MSVVVIGLNHRTVPLDLLERMTVDDARLPKALHDLVRATHVSEAVVLSTCNRTEVYAVGRAVPRRLRRRPQLPRRAGVPAARGRSPTTSTSTTTTTPSRHLFAVAAGLDSAVLGESEILGQVRERLGAGPGRRARPAPRSTCCSATPSRSASGPAPRPASPATSPRCRRPRWPWPPSGSASLDGRRVLVLGAGEMGEGMVARAGRRRRRRRRASPTAPGNGAVELADAGRRPGRPPGRPAAVAGRGRPAAHLHRRHLDHARARRPRRGHGAPATAGRCSSSTSPCPATSTRPPATLAGRDAARHGRPAGASPTPAWPSAGARSTAVQRISTRSSSASSPSPPPARSRRWSPALHERAEAIRQAELDRFRSRGWPSSTTASVDAVEALTKGIVAKLLHDPTVGLKDAAGTPQGRAPGRGPPRPVRPLTDACVAARPRPRQRPRPLADRPRRRPAACRWPDPGSRSSSWSSRRPGDRRQDIPIWEMGGKGVFVKEVQAAVLDGRADIAVHSAKDLPSGSPPGPRPSPRCPERGDAATRWSARRSTTCPPAPRVATGSARRRAQLAWPGPT